MHSFDGALGIGFTSLTIGCWSPEDDATARIVSARSALNCPALAASVEGWSIQGKNDKGEWIVGKEDLAAQLEAFVTFMSRVPRPVHEDLSGTDALPS